MFSTPSQRVLNRCMRVQKIGIPAFRPTSTAAISFPPSIRHTLPFQKLQRSSFSTASDAPQNIPRSRLRRFISVCALGIVFTTVGFVMAIAPEVSTITSLTTPPSDAATLELFTPPDELSEEIEHFIQNHPVAKALRDHGDYVEVRPHMKIPDAVRNHNLTGGTLSGPGKIWVPPLAFIENEGKTATIIFYLGNTLCGHPGIIHGGLLATILDEGLARCCFPALPNKVGMTANLNINYRKPLPANSYVCLRATTTRVEGRKAWVEGRIESLPMDGETPVVYAEASALFVEPKQAATMARLYPAAAG